MKNIAHLFSRDIVRKALERCQAGSKEFKSATSFEFVAALMMQRLYEEQWQKPTMIGFYLTPKYADILKRSEHDSETLVDVLARGIEEDNPVDFLLCTYDEENGAKQEFQLKRFGLGGSSNTDGLIAYLNGLTNRYAPSDAACLIAILDISAIDFETVYAAVNKDAFPFSELLLIGVFDDKFAIIGIKPDPGYSVYDLRDIIS